MRKSCNLFPSGISQQSQILYKDLYGSHKKKLIKELTEKINIIPMLDALQNVNVMKQSFLPIYKRPKYLPTQFICFEGNIAMFNLMGRDL